MKIEDYTYDQVKDAIDSSSSIKEFLQALGLPVNNGNYRRAEAIARQYALALNRHDSTTNGDTLRLINRLSDKNFFVDGVLRDGASIKKRLLALGVPHKCSVPECGQLPVWLGKPLVLTIDHIDGDKFNNTLENLRILCWHCHSQTDTYSNNRGEISYKYCNCGIRIPRGNKYCVDCRPATGYALPKGPSVRIEYPSLEIIVQTVKNLGGWSAAERALGIGQNSLRKHLRRNGVDPSTIQYKRKLQGDLVDKD